MYFFPNFGTFDVNNLRIIPTYLDTYEATSYVAILRKVKHQSTLSINLLIPPYNVGREEKHVG